MRECTVMGGSGLGYIPHPGPPYMYRPRGEEGAEGGVGWSPRESTIETHHPVRRRLGFVLLLASTRVNPEPVRDWRLVIRS